MKVTWKVIFTEFKKEHPELVDKILDYRPSAYMEIAIMLIDGRELYFKYETKELKYTGEWTMPVKKLTDTGYVIPL